MCIWHNCPFLGAQYIKDGSLPCSLPQYLPRVSEVATGRYASGSVSAILGAATGSDFPDSGGGMGVFLVVAATWMNGIVFLIWEIRPSLCANFL